MNAFSEHARARRYLLGRTTDQESADIEARYLADEEAIDELTLVEDDLIEAYLEGRLAADERASFEQAFMTAPRRRARVETVRLLRRAAPPASGISSTGTTGSVRWTKSCFTESVTFPRFGVMETSTWVPVMERATSSLSMTAVPSR